MVERVHKALDGYEYELSRFYGRLQDRLEKYCWNELVAKLDMLVSADRHETLGDFSGDPSSYDALQWKCPE